MTSVIERQGLVSAKLLALFSYVCEEKTLTLDGSLTNSEVNDILGLIEDGLDKIKMNLMKTVDTDIDKLI